MRRTPRTGAERRGAAFAVAGAMGAALATGVAMPVEGADPPPPEVRFAAGATRCVSTMFGAADRATGDTEPPGGDRSRRRGARRAGRGLLAVAALRDYERAGADGDRHRRHRGLARERADGVGAAGQEPRDHAGHRDDARDPREARGGDEVVGALESRDALTGHAAAEVP